MNQPPTKKQMAARRAALLPHPARDQIVDTMRGYGRPISPTQLSRITGGTLGSVAYHVRTLVAAGVLVLADEGRVRGAVEHFYVLTDDREPLSDPGTTMLVLCGASVLPSKDGAYPQTVVLDERGRGELLELLAEMKPKVRAIATASAARTAA
jgi:DNA-binding transcriptional ArsR family regulator